MIIGGRKAAAPYRPPYVCVSVCSNVWSGGFPAADNFFTHRRDVLNWHDEYFFVKISKKCSKNVVYVEFLW